MKKLLLCLSLLPLAACQAPLTAPSTPNATPGELVVRFQAGTTDAAKAQLRTTYGASDVAEILPNTERWKVPGASGAAITALSIDSHVQYAQPNLHRHLILPGDTGTVPDLAGTLARYMVQQATAAPNDPDYSQQWYLPRCGFDKVWGTTTGKGVEVAVVDSGVDPNHPDLKANLLPLIDEVVALGNHDTLNNTNYDGKDGHGHGTHVCGIVGAIQNNSIGITGGAPGVKILPVKVTTATGDADDVTISKGIKDACDQGAQVINLSIGGPDPSPILLDALNYAFGKNVAVVIASGNDGLLVNYPAAYNGVVSVGAITPDGSVASYSSSGDNLVLVAPGGSVPGTPGGQEILSCTPTYPCYITLFENKNNNYDTLAGTSMAAPQVTAAAALLLSQQKNLTPAQVRTRLAATADSPSTGLFDKFYGYGVLNVSRLLSMSQDDGRSK